VFGASTIIISIEAMRHADGSYEAYTDYGREPSGRNVFDWALEAESRGAGEILLTSILKDGTRTGFDLGLIKRVAKSVNIPVIAAGGAGSIQNIQDVLKDGCADAVCVASLLHYHLIHRTAFDEKVFSTEGNVEFLKMAKTSPDLVGYSLAELKRTLIEHGIKVRAVADAGILQ